MAQQMTVAPHLTVAELEQHYRDAGDRVARRQWQILWLLAFAGGPGRTGTGWGPVDRAAGGALDEPDPWPAGQPAAGVGVAAPTRLHAAAAASPGDAGRSGCPGRLQERGLAAQLARVRQAPPLAELALWAEDEHRLGLLPVVRRLWAPRGERPTAHVRRRYEWLYVYGFVRPATGHSWWALLPTANATAMSLALATFARDEDIDAAHRAVLVLDQAGWHTAHDLVVPDGIDLVLLPAQSPELQPAERLWPLLDEPIVNRAVSDLDALEAVLVERCRTLEADPARLKAHTRFYWWPAEPPPALRL